MTSTTARVTYGTVQLSDGPAIAYALHTPPSAPNQNVRLALVAHPLGRLGGSKEDHVVTALAGLLSNDLGYIVCRYDARGSGGSTGSASWTSSQPERDDLTALLKLVLYPLVRPSSEPEIDVLLVGYSAGSLAASCASVPAFVSHDTPNSGPDAWRKSVQIRVRRVLVSYPVGVLWALTALRPSPFTQGLERVFDTAAMTAHPDDHDGVPTDKTLAIWSTQDQFSSRERYQAWSARLQDVATRQSVDGKGSSWQGVEVDEPGADHFWRSRQAKQQMLQVLKTWLEE